MFKHGQSLHVHIIAKCYQNSSKPEFDCGPLQLARIKNTFEIVLWLLINGMKMYRDDAAVRFELGELVQFSDVDIKVPGFKRF